MRQRREGKRAGQPRRSVRQSESKQPGQLGELWVPLQVAENIEEMLLHWANYEGPKVGWCLLCDRPILSEDDFIPETNTHNCAAGWRFEREHGES